jgi:hypothetical protein
MADEQLKPCPFCGVRLIKMSEAQGYLHPTKNCTLSGFHMPADGYSEERWNTRAPADDSAVVEVLREARDLFRSYERSHAAKANEIITLGHSAERDSRLEKAARNAAMADRIHAITGASHEGR